MKKKIKTVVYVMLACALPACGINCGSKADATRENKAEIKTYKTTSQEIKTFIEATGSIQVDLEGGAKINPTLNGIVDKIFVKVGDKVTKGDSLLTIKSSEVSDTYADYLSNRAQLKQAERIYKLDKELHRVGAIAKNELINAEANYVQLKAVGEGYKKKLDIYGINISTQNNFQDQLFLKAPIDGVVTDIQIHVGDRVDPSNPVMVIADPCKVLVVANIYDTDIHRIHSGDEVIFYTDVLPDMEFKGRVTYVSDIEDLDTKTVKTYIKVSNEKNLFKLNMFLKIKIMEGIVTRPVVPKSALLYKDGEFYAYVKGQQGFELKKVVPALEVSEKLMAVDGLTDSEEVILSAIDMEKL